MSSMAASTVPKFYKSVIDDVIASVREVFLDDGVDEQVIQELKSLWERKIGDTHAVQQPDANATSAPPMTNSKSNSQSKKAAAAAAKEAAAQAAAAASVAAAAAAASQTSVITSNPNHIKNGPPGQTTAANSVRVKEEMLDEANARRHIQQQIQQQPPMQQQMTSSAPTLATNGSSGPQIGFLHQQQTANLAATLSNPTPTSLLRPSAIVSNPSGGLVSGGMTAPTSTPHLIQVLPSGLHRHSPGGAMASSGAQQQQLAASTTGSSSRSSIVTLIPSSSSSTSPSFPGQNVYSAVTSSPSSSPSFPTNHKANGGGSAFTPRIVAPKGTQHQHQQQQQQQGGISLNPAMANRVVLAAPHGHKKRILSSAMSDGNVTGLNGAPGNLSMAPNSQQMQTHLFNLQAQQRQLQQAQVAVAAQQQQQRTLQVSSSGGGPLVSSAPGLFSTAGLHQQLAAGNSQQQHLIRVAPRGSMQASGGALGSSNKQQTMNIGGQNLVLLPNNQGQFVMAAPQQQQPLVLTQEILNQLQMQGLLRASGQQFLNSGGLPGTIQFARAPGTLQQMRTIGNPTGLLGPGQVVGQPGTSNPNVSNTRVAQLDGLGDSSDDDEDEDDYRDNDDDQDDDDNEMNDEENDGGIEDEEPLNSEDDVSDEDPTELFDTDNVVVCQYDKITRSRNRWKFHFKDGIMNLQGKDYVFQKAVGDAEW